MILALNICRSYHQVVRTYRKSGFLTVRGIWLHCAVLFKHAVKSTGGGCVVYCRWFLSASITLTDSAPSYIWQQVRQRFLSICVTIFWLPVLIHSMPVKLVSHCAYVHFSLSLLWCVFVDCIFLFHSHCSSSFEPEAWWDILKKCPLRCWIMGEKLIWDQRPYKH